MTRDARLNPGPAYYEPNDQIIKDSSPQYRIDGNQVRLAGPSGDAVSNPGPGHYEKKNLIGGIDSTKFTIGEKTLGASAPNVPGPGHYQPNDDLIH